LRDIHARLPVAPDGIHAARSIEHEKDPCFLRKRLLIDLLCRCDSNGEEQPKDKEYTGAFLAVDHSILKSKVRASNESPPSPISSRPASLPVGREPSGVRHR